MFQSVIVIILIHAKNIPSFPLGWKSWFLIILAPESFFVRAIPEAYEVPRPGLHHSQSNTRFELCLWPTQQAQCMIINPPSGARGQTCGLVVTSWVHCHWATTGTPNAESFLTWPQYLSLNLVWQGSSCIFPFFPYLFFLSFFPLLQHMEVLGPGIESTPQQWPEPQQWQYQILKLLHH